MLHYTEGSGCVCSFVPRSVQRHVFRSSEVMCIFLISSSLLYYCFIHRAWTNYFNSSLHWGADWQLPSLEWSVCFLDSAEAIWCILTIIGATATMMFSKPLCYFPGGCPWGIYQCKLLGLQRRLSESGQMGGPQIRHTRSNHHYHLKGRTDFLVVACDQQISRLISNTYTPLLYAVFYHCYLSPQNIIYYAIVTWKRKKKYIYKASGSRK